MKRCPQCGRDYNDDSLSFCLDDGAELLFGPGIPDEPATAILHDTSPPIEAATRPQIHTTAPTEVFPLDSAKEQRSTRFDKRLVLAPVALAVIVLGGFFGYRYLGTTTQVDSIAVMPFANESANQDVEYLSDGMTETLIKSLSQ